MTATPAAGSRWRHPARGTSYEVLGVGHLEKSFPGGELHVFYLPLDPFTDHPEPWARPLREFADGRFEPLPAAPGLVCLVGSSRFKKEHEEEMAKLTMQGKIVLPLGRYGHLDGLDMASPDKAMLDALHRDKIRAAGATHVVNPGLYVGDSTRGEIEFAADLGRVVTFRELPPGDSWEFAQMLRSAFVRAFPGVRVAVGGAAPDLHLQVGGRPARALPAHFERLEVRRP